MWVMWESCEVCLEGCNKPRSGGCATEGRIGRWVEANIGFVVERRERQPERRESIDGRCLLYGAKEMRMRGGSGM